jgi:signal recognition particle subunit SEC65
MPTRRGPLLKKLRYYLAQMPPENLFPHKKLNAQTRAVLDTRVMREGLTELIEDVQQRILRSHLEQLRRRGQI